MSNTIRIRRSTGSQAPASLANAELAYSEGGGGTLYIGVGTGGAGGLATSVVAIAGGSFATKSYVDSAVSSVDVSAQLANYLTTSAASSTYLTQSNASSTYLTQSSASSTYLTQTSASSTYLTQSSAASTYLTQSSAASTYLPLTGGTVSSNLTVQGNLTVTGTTTTVDSTTVNVADKNIVLGNVASPNDTTADGGGITLKGATDKTLNWVDATDAWTSSEHLELASGKSYRINGSAVLSAAALGSGVTGSSLTSVGTLTSGTLGTGFTTVAVSQGGTGVATLTGLVKGNGTSAFSAAVAGTDYLSPSSDIDGGSY